MCLYKAQEIFGDGADFVNRYKQKDSFVVLLKNIFFLGNILPSNYQYFYSFSVSESSAEVASSKMRISISLYNSRAIDIPCN